MSSPFVERLGWTLLHSVWQGALIAFLLAGALFSMRKSSAASRYGLSCAALVLMLAAPVVTFLALVPEAPSLGVKAWLGGEVPSKPFLNLAVGAWSVGMAIMTLRLIGSLLNVELWRRRQAQPADASWQGIADSLAKRLGIFRKVSLLISGQAPVPCAWGILRPVILLPVSLAAHLSPAQVEAILLHELAHIRRYDYLANLLQTVVETVLFYHPAVWWMSKLIRQEREHCCDDIVVKTLGDPMSYASALLRLEERRYLPQLSLSAKGGSLKVRIARIVGGPSAPLTGFPLVSTLMAAGTLAIFLFLGVGGNRDVADRSRPLVASVVSIQPETPAKVVVARKTPKIAAPAPKPRSKERPRVSPQTPKPAKPKEEPPVQAPIRSGPEPTQAEVIDHSPLSGAPPPVSERKTLLSLFEGKPEAKGYGNAVRALYLEKPNQTKHESLYRLFTDQKSKTN